MRPFSFLSNCEADTDIFGHQLADVLPNGSVVALVGTLGAGKTRLVKAIAKANGCSEHSVSSPTFVLIHEYTGGIRPIFHVDAYRIQSESEFLRLGIEEYFETDGLTFIEWADRFPNVLPPEYVEIQIDVLGETERRFNVIPKSDALHDG